MLLRLLLLFTIVPLVELYLLLQLSDWTDWKLTIALVIVTGLLGAALAKWQGLVTLMKIRSEMSAGKLPAASMMDGVLILLAGALLVTPGILTDTVGFLLLLPAFRRLLRTRVMEWFKRRVSVHVGQHMQAGFRSGRTVVDVEVTQEDEESPQAPSLRQADRDPPPPT